MSNAALDRAIRERDAADAKVKALSRIPTAEEEANWSAETVIAWKTVDNKVYSAVKTRNGWKISGRDTYGTWATLVSNYLTGGLSYFRVASPAHAKSNWESGLREEPEAPGVEIYTSKKGMVLHDLDADIRWQRHGNTWERLD